MSEILIRRLLTPVTPMQRVRESDAERYRGGLSSSYVHRAQESIVAAEALSGRARDAAGHEILASEMRRATEHVIKAARVSLGLSATRERDLKILVLGRASDVAPVPPGPVCARLRALLEASETSRLDNASIAHWIGELHASMAEITRLPALAAKPRRATPRT